MPLGNYTSQFFANVYLDRFDHFVKHSLKARHYVRYVDDFVIFHKHRKQLNLWKEKIDEFLNKKLKLQLHPQKTQIIPLSKGIDFVGFRNFTHHRLLRKRNIIKMQRKIDLFRKGLLNSKELMEAYQSWQAYANWAHSYKSKGRIKEEIIKTILEKI